MKEPIEVFCRTCGETEEDPQSQVVYNYDDVYYCQNHADIKFIEVRAEANIRYNKFIEERGKDWKRNPYDFTSDLFDDVECSVSRCKNKVVWLDNDNDNDEHYCDKHIPSEEE